MTNAISSRWKRWVLVAVATAMAALAGSFYNRFYKSVLWPERVQREIFGKAIAQRGSQMSGETDFAYGQGFAHWRYRISPRSLEAQELCRFARASRCAFIASRRLENGVNLYVVYRDGVLTVEEWWS